MHPFEYIHEQLKTRMIEGQMHPTLRNLGRLAGGLLASGSLTHHQISDLCSYAQFLALDVKLAEKTWNESVVFGQRAPVSWARVQLKADRALDWDDEIGGGDYHIVDTDWIEPIEVTEPKEWDPAAQIRDYLESLFDADDYVGYCMTHTHPHTPDEKPKPLAGAFTRTKGQLLALMDKYKDDDPFGKVFLDYTKEVGAWIRFNPLDGQGCKDENVTAYRYALVESDTMPVEEQRAIYNDLKLPIKLLIHSGNKSLHALVMIGANDIQEYKRRVTLLYDICEKNGLKVDRANGNPSRYSRMPGVERGANRQYIVAKDLGMPSWAEWEAWSETVCDDLPAPESLSDAWKSLPPLSPPLIDGVLRQGHKLLLSGPSKAGKSYLLIQLCAAIAEGREWLGWDVAQGRVLYVNLELDRASCLHRFKHVYDTLGWDPEHIKAIDIWNLRGKSMPMDRLTPKLTARSRSKQYSCVVIDPIYKVITGDENAADKMAYFCNQFDRVCHDLNASVIYCHHHSKGLQGQKRSMDRASGSGVFARDPDAVLDLIELDVAKDILDKIEEEMVCKTIASGLDIACPDWRDHTEGADTTMSGPMLSLSSRLLGLRHTTEVLPRVAESRRLAQLYTAWQVEGTMREFARAEPTKIWFAHPLHRPDTDDLLKWAKPYEPNKKEKPVKEDTTEIDIRLAHSKVFSDTGKDVKVVDLAAEMEIHPKTLRDRLTKLKRKGWGYSDGIVIAPSPVSLEGGLDGDF